MPLPQRPHQEGPAAGRSSELLCHHLHPRRRSLPHPGSPGNRVSKARSPRQVHKATAIQATFHSDPLVPPTPRGMHKGTAGRGGGRGSGPGEDVKQEPHSGTCSPAAAFARGACSVKIPSGGTCKAQQNQLPPIGSKLGAGRAPGGSELSGAENRMGVGGGAVGQRSPHRGGGQTAPMMWAAVRIQSQSHRITVPGLGHTRPHCELPRATCVQANVSGALHGGPWVSFTLSHICLHLPPPLSTFLHRKRK